MRKLRLDVDDLRVESFATDQEGEGRGTVEAYISRYCSAGDRTCNGANTCDGMGASCYPVDTCYVSCAGSCPCYPNYPGSGTDCGIESADYTCDPCDVTQNEVYTCLAAQSCGFYTPCQ